MRKFLLAIFLCAQAQAAPNVLSNTAHAAANINAAAIAVLGAGIVDVTVFSDETSIDDGTSFLGPTALITATQDTSRNNFRSANNSGPVNHAPYALTTTSSTGYSLSLDTANYTASNTNQVLSNFAMVFAFTTVTPPPVYFSNIALNSNTSAANWGVEFTMSTGYKGLDTSTSSSVTANFAGLLIALKFNHPTFNWQDVKGALRQTASNWATGYNRTTYGYGTINYDTANAIASSSSLYLQPPILQATNGVTNQITLTLYPYRQTRRHHEVVYLVPAGYSWPVKNEYTTSDITASSGTLLYTSNGTDIIPTATVSFNVAPGLYNLIGFTTDNLGNYSRVESFSPTAVMDQCL